MPFISSFDIISIVLLCEAQSERCLPDPKSVLCIPASAADAAAVNPKGFKIPLAKGLTTFFINGNPDFNNEVCQEIFVIVNLRVFDSLISVVDL